MVISVEPVWSAGFVFLFWSSLAALCYSYAGYPVLVFLVAKLFPVSNRKTVMSSQESLPRLTVLIVAHNAEHHIRERIKNVLACDYPSDRIEVLIASDGSTDATVALVKAFDHPRVRALDFPQRRGKTKTLVDAVRHVDGDVILFTDATNQFDRDSILHLARHFADPQIGMATGKVTLLDEFGEPSESVYWKMEMMIRRSEMRLGILLGANGPLYAIRRNLFVEPKRPVINDDFVLPLLAHLRHGCGIVCDETARVYMLSSGGLTSEFRRRCRIGAGAFQSLPILIELLRWRHAKQAIAFASHKLMRWMGPFLLAALLISNLALLPLAGYGWLMGIQSVAYLLAIMGLFVPGGGPVLRFVRTASSFLVMNLALLAGFFRWVRDPQNVIWSPTPRPVTQSYLATQFAHRLDARHATVKGGQRFGLSMVFQLAKGASKRWRRIESQVTPADVIPARTSEDRIMKDEIAA